MKLRFLGGVDEVGSLSMLADINGRNILFDYGLTPTYPPKFPLDPPPVERMFLSHAHIDHSGMIPRLAGLYSSHVTCTSISSNMTKLLLEDSLNISRKGDYPLPYSRGDFRAALELFDIINFDAIRQVGEVPIFFHPAGHIPGSTMFEIGYTGGTALFTGDINTVDTQLLYGCKPVKCDILIVESTYAGREHFDRTEIEKQFKEKVEEVTGRGGLAVVPAFAVGRSQEVMMLLASGDYDLYLDGMGNYVAKLLLKAPEFLRSHKKLQKVFRKVRKIMNPDTRQRVDNGDVVVTTSGMLDGGPVIEYINKIRKDPKSAVLITGYQVEGTNGRMLLDTGKMNIRGVDKEVECETAFFDLSAHSGHTDLVNFIKGCDPQEVVLCHGDNREALVDDLQSEDFKVLLPKVNEEVKVGV
jgi:putative mRNA 3-end processing factor